ncbi:MAG: hypothetical protein AMJ84_08135 [Acidithiobacillales bacterium SM23_46]|nr:MAG: hypothetical protein AMJ84_08135 [Acidithiobacillales bacterium SM23_46]KPL28842.1 MAG: hypothetical protein AMJ72_01080 [Acidithiobacillales bacterium SM1_46]
MNLRLRLDCTTRLPVPAVGKFRRWARAALSGWRRRSVAIGVRIVGAAESRTLNLRYRGKDQPTNVLSFPYEAPPGARTDVLGDLVICAPLVRREARAEHKDEQAHWAHLVVHGILHLRGYDHENARQAAIMEDREVRILRRLGFPNPYT